MIAANYGQTYIFEVLETPHAERQRPGGPETSEDEIAVFHCFSPSRVFTFGVFTVVVKDVKASCWVLLVQGGLLQVRLIYLMATLARRKVSRSSVFEANRP